MIPPQLDAPLTEQVAHGLTKVGILFLGDAQFACQRLQLEGLVTLAAHGDYDLFG
jgi:hypothetical protein